MDGGAVQKERARQMAGALVSESAQACGIANELPMDAASVDEARLLSSNFAQGLDRMLRVVSGCVRDLHGLGGDGGDAAAEIEPLFQLAAEYSERHLDLAEQALQRSRQVNSDGCTIAHDRFVASSSAGLRSVAKPQLLFYDWPIDNSPSPFVPKFHATRRSKTLDESFSTQGQELGRHCEKSARDGSPKVIDDAFRHLQGLYVYNNNNEPAQNRQEHAEGVQSSAHPYLEENMQAIKCQLEFARKVPVQAQMYEDWESTECEWIDTPHALERLAQELEEASKALRLTEIAVDLEAHSERSYQGFTCLMQLSTRQKDYVIDTIALREHMRLLTPVFLDQRVVKVFHGARSSDIGWLQRDFGMYVVNLFDTGEASMVLDLPKKSLAYLLLKFCGLDTFATKKGFQRSDWRQRPLPDLMLDYARSDTHYLLYIYDQLRMLLAQEPPECFEAVLCRSLEVCLQMYHKPAFDPNGWRRLDLLRGASTWDAPQQRVMHALWEWRDKIARQEDENPHFVLPVRSMLRIVFRKTNVAHEKKNLVRLLEDGVVPEARPLIKRYMDSLCELVHDAANASGKYEEQFFVSGTDEEPHDAQRPKVPGKSAVHTVFESDGEGDRARDGEEDGGNDSEERDGSNSEGDRKDVIQSPMSGDTKNAAVCVLTANLAWHEDLPREEKHSTESLPCQKSRPFLDLLDSHIASVVVPETVSSQLRVQADTEIQRATERLFCGFATKVDAGIHDAADENTSPHLETNSPPPGPVDPSGTSGQNDIDSPSTGLDAVVITCADDIVDDGSEIREDSGAEAKEDQHATQSTGKRDREAAEQILPLSILARYGTAPQELTSKGKKRARSRKALVSGKSTEGDARSLSEAPSERAAGANTATVDADASKDQDFSNILREPSSDTMLRQHVPLRPLFDEPFNLDAPSAKSSLPPSGRFTQVPSRTRGRAPTAKTGFDPFARVKQRVAPVRQGKVRPASGIRSLSYR
ncbi:Exosome component 10 [Porphyridium purpureum]|uniref:Exosome component 10 n=1 Tax=Porphyridium purpureum TaxID=35688 RepID=A0A5J4YR57_PORPP|nr:Exosome component 10 [Porphyridium purpureum]|eukprot:POR1755..scf222_8